MSDRRERLGLRPGDIVEVRSATEILATLDEHGMLDALPFMPEMLQFCGKRLRVQARADKTCDTIGTSPTHARRMHDTVHLDSRCDGSRHGGCQAQCLLFWKEAWLKRVDTATIGPEEAASTAECEAFLMSHARRSGDPTRPDAPSAYVCQATELVRASATLPWWDARQYVRDYLSGNVDLWNFVLTITRAVLNAAQRLRGGRQFPNVEAHCKGATPTGNLNLQPGELVRIRRKEEIFATLNEQGRNRGLFFDVEMLPFCGRTAVVKQRVTQVIDEKTGKMLHFSNPCIMLENVVCSGCLSRERLFCPRAIYSYWREIWLERAMPEFPVAEKSAGSAQVLSPAERAGRETAGAIP